MDTHSQKLTGVSFRTYIHTSGELQQIKNEKYIVRQKQRRIGTCNCYTENRIENCSRTVEISVIYHCIYFKSLSNRSCSFFVNSGASIYLLATQLTKSEINLYAF